MFEGSNEKETSFACVIVGLMFKVRQRMLALTICYPPRLYRRFMLLCLCASLHIFTLTLFALHLLLLRFYTIVHVICNTVQSNYGPHKPLP
jgi:hypothetical protein